MRFFRFICHFCGLRYEVYEVPTVETEYPIGLWLSCPRCTHNNDPKETIDVED